MSLLYHKTDSVSSEIFGLRRMWNNSLRELWNIAPSSQCEMKFAHIRVSEYFTFAEQIFHSEAISLARRANFVEKSTCLRKCFFLTWHEGFWTHTCALGRRWQIAVVLSEMTLFTGRFARRSSYPRNQIEKQKHLNASAFLRGMRDSNPRPFGS